MNRYRAAIAVWMCSLITLAGCGGGETPVQGSITAQISCTESDSLLATIYMAGGDEAAASEWCSCTQECAVEFGGLGLGDYVLNVGRPDSTYLATDGAQGFVRPLGYYGSVGLAPAVDAATTISLTTENPNASVHFSLDDDEDAPPSDTLNGSASQPATP